MLRTSRKWKNAVRFQARSAFPVEWKVKELANPAAAVLLQAPSCTLLDLSGAIAVGTGPNQRLGSQIRIRRITIHLFFSSAESPGRENRGCVQLECHRWPLRLGAGAPAADARVLYADTVDIGIDWTNGAPRVLGGTTFGSPAIAALGTRDLVHVLSRKKYSLFAPARFVDRAVIAPATLQAFPAHHASTSDGLTQYQETSIVLRSNEYTNATGPGASFTQTGGNPTGIGSLAYNTGYPEGRGRFHQRITIAHSFGPNGMKIQYGDSGASEEPQNAVYLRLGSSYLSYNEEAGAGEAPAKFTYYIRIWYTDA